MLRSWDCPRGDQKRNQGTAFGARDHKGKDGKMGNHKRAHCLLRIPDRRVDFSLAEN